MTSRTSYRSFQSFQQKLPNTAAQSEAFRSALNAPTPSAPGRERWVAIRQRDQVPMLGIKRRDNDADLSWKLPLRQCTV